MPPLGIDGCIKTGSVAPIWSRLRTGQGIG
jgi:hypothetical protein